MTAPNSLKTARKMTHTSNPTPPAPVAHQLLYPPNPQTLGQKLPRLETPPWSGKSFDFNSWIPSCSKLFDQSNCETTAGAWHMLQAMPIDKKSIDGWNKFTDKLIYNFGNIDVIRCKALNQFHQLEQTLQTMKDHAPQLAPMVSGLKSYIKCIPTTLTP